MPDLSHIEIVKQGSLPSEKKYAMRCSHCRCEFIVTGAEHVKYAGSQYNDDYYKCPCPTQGCGSEASGEPLRENKFKWGD